MRTPRANTAEGYLKPKLLGEFTSSEIGTFYSRFSSVGTLSRGDGDLGGGTQGDEQDIDAEEYMAGWRSGDLMPGLGKDTHHRRRSNPMMMRAMRWNSWS